MKKAKFALTMVGMMSIISSALAYKAMRANLVGWTNGDETMQMKLSARLIADTPPFFTKARNIGLVLTAISTALIGLPAVPVIIAKIATYLAVAGTVLSGISQAAVYEETSTEVSE